MYESVNLSRTRSPSHYLARWWWPTAFWRKCSTFVFLTLSTIADLNLMARNPLSSAEQATLSNVAEYNRPQNREGWRFNGRVISGLNLTGLQLRGATITDVEFENVILDKAAVVDSRFLKVEFNGGQAQKASFENVTFTNCAFLGYDSKEATFKKCTFKACKMEKWELEDAHFEDCVWEDCETDIVEFANNSLVRHRFVGGRLKDLRFYHMRFENVTFSGAVLNHGLFNGISGQKLEFIGGQIENTGFDATPDFSGLLFSKATVRQTRFTHFNAKEIKVSECPLIETLSFSDSRLRNFTLQKGPDIFELHFIRTTLSDATLESSTIDSLAFSDSTVDGQTVLRDLHLGICDWSKSHLVGLKIEACTFYNYFAIDQSQFERLKMSRVSYGPKFKSMTEGAKFVDGDSIGLPASPR